MNTNDPVVMDELDITKFCATLDPRTYLNQPFTVDGYACASNGHVFVCSPSDEVYDSVPENTKKFTIDLIKDIDVCALSGMPKIVMPELAPCLTCDGCGKASMQRCEKCCGSGDCDHCGAPCDRCNGDGEITRAGGDKNCHECQGLGKYYNRHKWVDVCGVNETLIIWR